MSELNQKCYKGPVVPKSLGIKGFSLQDDSLHFYSIYLNSCIAEFFNKMNQKFDDRKMKSLISKKWKDFLT